MVVRRQRLRDGRWNAVRTVKGDPATSGIRIIGISADPAVQQAAEEAGCDLFLADPDPWRLVAEVERLIGPARGPAPGS